MRSRMIVAIGIVLVALLPNRGWTQTSASSGPTEELIVQARQKGIAFLKSKQLDEGNWEFPGHEVGITALCTLALLENGVPQSDPAIEKGQRFVKKNVKELGSTYDITLAIVILSRLDEHGNKSIIRDLGARLIAGQNTGGGWSYSCPAKVTALSLTNPDSRPKWPEAHNDKGLSQTAFAILFLRKANLGSDISRLLEGEPEKSFVIVNRADKPRFGSLEEALKAAQPGDTLRVDGDGPFKLPHVVVDQNLTIAAGFGYLPTFVYEIGFDARGIRSQPDKDPEARYLLKVSNTTLTLEGLKFDFNPPELAQNIPWSVIRVAGGELRILNCSITEEGRKGTVLVEVTEPARVQMRNCLLGGGRAAVELAANGQQSVEADNCLLFSDNCLAVVKHSTAKEAETSLAIRTCTVQGTNAVHAPVTTPLKITAVGNLFKTEWIGNSLLVTDNSKKDRIWEGSDNVYGVSKWLGTNGRASTAVSDVKTFAKFWGVNEKGSTAKQIIFEGKRPNKSASHRMRATEFALAAQSELGLTASKAGMQFLIVGAGRAFSRYRESSLYNDWKNSLAAK